MLSVRRTRGHRVFEQASLGLDALVRFGDGNCVVADFPFGMEFKADFVALAPFSGGWEIHFVELQPPDVHLFNLDGAAAKSLNRAITQVSEWRTFIEKNRPTVLRDPRR